MRVPFTLLTFFSLSFLLTQAQSDSAKTATQLSEFSLEQLMDIPIYSVSKTNESSFDAPLSSSVVTREEIKRAGCTTIMEAMRLVPGVIVRQMTNGNYDIHIRGLDNTPPNLGMYFFTNSTTLVMIDGRPVYNYVQGGTFWETLPIDLNDVEKIEVVRGPAAAMYGPNAESGVINIITRNPEKEGLYLVGNAQYGNYTTAIANGSVGYKAGTKFSAIVSGNFQLRDRTQSGYYNDSTNKFVPLDSFVKNAAARNAQYPHPDLAMQKYGYNAFINYYINDKAYISLQGGGQGSEVQNEFASAFLTNAVSNTYYGNLKAGVYGINLQASYLTGTQAPQTALVEEKWQLNSTDVVLDYNMTAVKNLTITPGLSYRQEEYNDSKYVDAAMDQGLFNAPVTATTLSASLRFDYKLFHDKLRIVAAGRMDKFNAPDKIYFSWNLAATYKLSDKHLIRIVESRANQCPLLLNNYYNLAITVPGKGSIQLLGNQNLQLLTTDMLEFGYRGKLTDHLELDLEVYGSKTYNFYNEVFTSLTIDTAKLLVNIQYHFENLPLVSRQMGATLSVNYVMGKIQLRPFATLQHTTLFNYSPYAALPTAPGSAINNINSGLGTQMDQLATPTFYGGAYINFEITKQFNINMNAYYMTACTQLESDNLNYNNGLQGVENIAPQFLVNVVASYTFFKKLTIFANFKNCFNEQTRQFYRGDIPGFQVSGGANLEF